MGQQSRAGAVMNLFLRSLLSTTGRLGLRSLLLS